MMDRTRLTLRIACNFLFDPEQGCGIQFVYTAFLWLMAGDYQEFNRSNDPEHAWVAG